MDPDTNPMPEEPTVEPVVEPTPVPPIDANLRIVYPTPEGGVAVVVPAVDCGLTIEEIIAKDVPAGVTAEVVDVSAIPSDRTFRNAWKPKAGGVDIDLPKAKDIQKGRWRAKRAGLLAALDVEYQRADENGDAAAKQSVAARKRALRDVTTTPFPSDNPSDIAAFWPAVLNG